MHFIKRTPMQNEREREQASERMEEREERQREAINSVW
jgi:hypothetical protein